jgi:hypothetical protein
VDIVIPSPPGGEISREGVFPCCYLETFFFPGWPGWEIRLPAVDTLKRYSKALEYEYRVKTAALDTLKRYSILSLYI